MDALKCQGCRIRDEALDPARADFLVGNTPSCRNCVDWIIDSLRWGDDPITVRRLNTAS